MEVVLRYLAASISDAALGGFSLFGGTVVLSILLHHASAQLRKVGASWLGRKYFYLVAAGVACHETGHALGCLLMYPLGVRIAEYVPFRPQSNGTLGWVGWRIVGRPSAWGVSIAKVVIGTGPIWFGCLAVYLLTALCFSMPEVNASVGEGFVEKLVGVFDGALNYVVHIFHGISHRPLLSVVYIYLTFCIVSEMELSDADMKGMWQGIACFIVLFVLLHMIPFLDVLVGESIRALAAYVVSVNAIMLAVLLVNLLLSSALSLMAPEEG